MKKIITGIIIALLLGLVYSAFAQNAEQESKLAASLTEPLPEQGEDTARVAAGNISLDFKDADIHNVLKVLSYKSGVNIVAGPEVTGLITIRLTDVPWDKALDVILKTYGYGYDRDDSIISVTTMDNLQERREKEKLAVEAEPIISKVFNLKFLDAGDAKTSLEPMLSERGRISVVETTGQRGWGFGAEKTGKRERVTEKKATKSKILIITDTSSALERIETLLADIDVRPKQILIEARIMEVNRDRLKDMGIDIGTGSGGAETKEITDVILERNRTDNKNVSSIGGHVLGSQVETSVFGDKSGIEGKEPFDAGLELVFKKLTGIQFEVMLHALEEDIHTNTLSAPRIMTLNNQEATILVGTKYPILKETASEASTTSTVKELDYYQDIGIQLNVVPQVSADNYINMIVHPAVTSWYAWVASNYPIIITREAETQVLMKDGETIVIGGLLKDVESKGKFSVPILGDIPILGLLFQRRTTDIEKVELLIFITAHIVKPGEEVTNFTYNPELIKSVAEDKKRREKLTEKMEVIIERSLQNEGYLYKNKKPEKGK